MYIELQKKFCSHEKEAAINLLLNKYCIQFLVYSNNLTKVKTRLYELRITNQSKKVTSFFNLIQIHFHVQSEVYTK